jgi:hypothetical protein
LSWHQAMHRDPSLDTVKEVVIDQGFPVAAPAIL